MDKTAGRTNDAGLWGVQRFFVICCCCFFFLNLFLCFLPIQTNRSPFFFFIVLIALGRQFYHRKLSEYTALGNHDRYKKKCTFISCIKKRKTGSFRIVYPKFKYRIRSYVNHKSEHLARTISQYLNFDLTDKIL